MESREREIQYDLKEIINELYDEASAYRSKYGNKYYIADGTIEKLRQKLDKKKILKYEELGRS